MQSTKESAVLASIGSGVITAYHGTSEENAASIRKEGFRAGTWFAYKIRDAHFFGGPWVFAVRFDDDGFRGSFNDEWQFHLRNSLPPEVILSVKYLPWVTYMVRCSDGTLYTGVTNDLEKRMKTHNAGKGAKYTRSRLPVTLVYTEAHGDRSAAQRAEASIKGLRRAEKIALVES